MNLAHLALWALAVAGAALVLTQSSITAPVRDALAWIERRLRTARERHRLLAPPHELARLLAKLTACPMCCGFWIGAVSARLTFGGPVAWIILCGFAGSLAGALAVA